MRAWIEPYLKQYKFRIILAVILGVLGIGSGAMLLFVSGYLISKSALRPENIMIVYVPIVSVRAFSIGQAAFLYVEKLVSHDIALRVLEKMRTKLYHIIEPQALFLRSRFQTGDLLGVLSDDIEHLQDLYLRTIFPGIVGLVIYTIIIIVFSAFDWIFAIIMALMLGVLVFLVPLVSFFLRRKQHIQITKHRNRLYEQLTDAMFGLTDWLASGRQGEWNERFFTADKNLLRTEKNIQTYQQIRDALSQLVVGMIILAMIIWSSIQMDAGHIQPTVIAAFILMIFSITDALLPMSDAVERVPTYIDSLERINNVEHHSFTLPKEKQHQWQQDQKAHIHLNHVSYQYPGSDMNILTNISLSIREGSKIAILGRSGAGKSTLLKLLAGAIEPTNGNVLLNDEKMDDRLVSKAVSVLNQKPHLFNTSIANNIRIGRPDATDDDVNKAADQAQLTPLIDSLQNGIHTQMEEMGQRFSGGERQRIAFARVLLQETPIILIDEATIGLDPITEKSLIKTVLEATKDKTVIWITHHLTGAESMDEVIFLKDGQVSMHGSHEELLQTNSHYQKLYAMDQGLDIK